MNSDNILPLRENFKLSKEQQFTIRLHDHGLLRLIKLFITEKKKQLIILMLG